MEKKDLQIGDIVRHTSSNEVVDEMTVKKIETKGIHGQSAENPHFVCSFFSSKSKDVEYRSFERHEIEFIRRPEKI